MPKLDRVLQKDILAIALKNKNSLSNLKKIVKPEFFSIGAYRFLINEAYQHYEKFNGELPTKKTIILSTNRLIKDEERRKDYIKKIIPLFERKVKSPKFIESEILEWAKKQSFGILLENAAREGSEGNVDKAINLIKESFVFDVSKSGFQVHSHFEEWKDRQRKRKEDSLSKKYKIMKMGLKVLDDKMKIRSNESFMGLIMGTSGVGKSIFSINTGVSAIISGYNAVHFVYENTITQTETRYDSRFIDYPYSLIKDFKWAGSNLVIANKIMRNFRRKRKRNLKIIHAPISTISIMDTESLLREIEIKENWKPNLIIYDSPDHMIPHGKSESFRLGVKKVYEGVKWQSEIRNIPIWCTTHARSSAKGSRVRQEASAESYDKARLADGVITISQTQEQEDDRQAELRLDKFRDDESGITILVDLLFRVMLLRYIETIDNSRETVVTD